jgi:peptide/nickel transport system substrate-binding protein
MRPIRASVLLLIAFLVLGCAAGGAQPRPATAPEQAPAAPKRITAAIMTEPATLFLQMDVGTLPGTDTMQALVHAGLSVVDDRGGRRPQLAEQVPSLENGLWKLFADGRMETTWHIRSGAQWHDGTPVTADDLLFTVAVGQDKELPRFSDIDFKSVESLEAVDPRTITVRWREPFVDADRMFAAEFAYPLPRHLLEATYRDNKSGFMDLLYWSTEYVGAGPFRLREWEPGSHILLDAFDGYPLGRPKIDTIEVKLIPYGNTLVASVLAGVVELTLGRSISVEQAAQVSEQWREGRVEVSAQGLTRLWWQFLNPNPRAILDVRFRRALLQAIDRDEMAETLQRGVTPAAHSFLSPGQPQYREIEDRYLVRYNYDLRQALEALTALGYQRAADGQLRDSAGQPLTIPLIVSPSQEINVRSTLAVADYWKQLGVETTAAIQPERTGIEKLRYEAEWPGFTLIRGNNDLEGVPSLHSSQARLPERGYNGTNRGNYMNPELDGLIDRYFVTIPQGERTEILGQILHHISDQLPVLPLYYGAEAAVIANRLVGVGVRPAGSAGQTQAWNAHEWDVADGGRRS